MNDEQSAVHGPIETFAANLRAAREAHGWNQSELARRMIERGWDKYSQVSVKRTENAERAVRLDEALVLAAVLGVSLSALLGERAEDHAGPLLALIAEAEDAQDALRSAAQRLERVQERLQSLGDDPEHVLNGWARMRLDRVLTPPVEYLLTMDAVAAEAARHEEP